MWKTFFQELRQRGRDATLFVLVFLALLVAAPFLGPATDFVGDHVKPETALAGLVLALLAGIWAAVRRWRRRPQKGTKFPPLSNDDLRVARSKLVKGQKRTRL